MKEWNDHMFLQSTDYLLDKLRQLTIDIKNEFEVGIWDKTIPNKKYWKKNIDYVYELSFKKWALISILISRERTINQRDKFTSISLYAETCPMCLVFYNNDKEDSCSRCPLNTMLKNNSCENVGDTSYYGIVKQQIRYNYIRNIPYEACVIRNCLYALAVKEIHGATITRDDCYNAAKYFTLPTY